MYIILLTVYYMYIILSIRISKTHYSSVATYATSYTTDIVICLNNLKGCINSQ